MLSKEKQIDLFFDNIEGASEYFYVDSKGNLHTHVNTDYIFPKFEIEVFFHKSFIQINTQISDKKLIQSNKKRIKSIETLLESLNPINKNGHFFLNKKTQTITFMSLCFLEDIINADNPWLILFSGIETISFFADSIQEVIGGSNTFYLKHPINSN